MLGPVRAPRRRFKYVATESLRNVHITSGGNLFRSLDFSTIYGDAKESLYTNFCV